MPPKVLIFSTSNYLSSLKMNLTSENVELIEAHGEENLEAATGTTVFDLIILDSNDENKLFQISEKIRATFCNTQAPILYVSTKKISLAQAFNGYDAAPILGIVKPFSPKDLINSVNILLKLKKQKDELIKKNHELEEALRDNENKSQLIESQRVQLFNQSKLSSLGEMAGGIAHEINTPLTAISLMVEQMQEALGENDFTNFTRNLEVIEKTTDRIAKIVRGLKLFARDGKQDKPETVIVSALIEDAISLCYERFVHNGVEISLDQSAADTTLKVECQRIEISQVLLNLLNNAFDAVQSLEQKWVRVGVRDEDEYVEFSVTDSGFGIPAEIKEKVMQPFFTTKDVGKGTGLGLSISKGIIDRHQGQFYIDSCSAHTKFVMLIPKSHRGTGSNGTAA